MLKLIKTLLISEILLLVVSISIVNASEGKLFTGSESIPKDAIVLFDGKSMENWMLAGTNGPAPWKCENGYMQVGGGCIYSKQRFTDCQIHLEFWLPSMPNSHGQMRANSGVYVSGLYEVQVLDVYGFDIGKHGCGAIYDVVAPMVNAAKPPETWQTYDILYFAPRFDEQGRKISSARISLVWNGLWALNNVKIPGPTASNLGNDPKEPGPIMLQDHGDPVRYRNIWVRPLGGPVAR